MSSFRQIIRYTGLLIVTNLALAALFVRIHRWRYVAALAVLAVVLPVLMQFDPVLLPAAQVQTPGWRQVGSTLSEWGKTDHVTLLVVVGLFAAAAIWRRRSLARLGLCVLLAVAVSGISVNILRPAFGRARPYSEHAGEFHWLETTHEFNSFPSGHSSEAWAVATVLVATCPPAVIPCGLYAGSMLWARMEVDRHFPSDVLAGMAWGILCALPFAATARKVIADKV